MQEADQLQLIREFMLKLAPVITRETLRNTEAQSPAQNAQMTLEWAFHLAAQFSSCYDQFHAPENTPQAPDPVAEKLKAIAAGHRETQGRKAGVQPEDPGL